MKPARATRWTISLVVVALILPVTARAFLPPQGGQQAYEIPLREFDLEHLRSAAVEADRSRVEAALSQAYDGIWKVYSWNPQSRTPREMYGSGVDLAASLTTSDQVRFAAERVIRDNGAAFGADLAGLRFEEATSSPPVETSPDGIRRPGKWGAHFQQVYHGLDVIGGEVHMTFTDTGRMFALGSTYYGDIAVDWTPSISAERAKEIASGSLPFRAETDSAEARTELLVLPVPVSETEVEHHLVWEARVHTREPLGVWVTRVDAHSGRILSRTNAVKFWDFVGSTAGQVERYSYCDGSQQEAFPYVYVNTPAGTTTSDANGNWIASSWYVMEGDVSANLWGPYVWVQNAQGPSAYLNTYASAGVYCPIVFDDSNSRADERDVYQTVQGLHNFFESFAPGFGRTNQAVMAYVNMNQTCNAYYQGNAIHFYKAGGTCANTGQMMDVVAHEYGHGVQEWIMGWQDAEGLHEGNSDVLAFLTTHSSLIGLGFWNCSSGLRNAHNSLKYPDDVVGMEEHYAGRVIAGFHWDAVQEMVARYGDSGWQQAARDWHYGRLLQQPLSQPAQVLATFIANDNDGNLTNGTPQYDCYCLGATNHGFDCPDATLWLGPWGCSPHYQSPQWFGINQQDSYWTVVGVSPSSGDDKDIKMYGADYSTLLAGSTGYQGTDFVVGDFNHNPHGAYHPRVSYGGSTTPYVVSWDAGSDMITPGVPVSGEVGGQYGDCGLARAWDVYLSAGQTYTVALERDGGGADIRLSLFRNPAAAPYWAGRYMSQLELEHQQSVVYTAPASDWYGVVVFNNSPDMSWGHFIARVEPAPLPLTSEVCRSESSSPQMFSFAQQSASWACVAVNPRYLDDKDLWVYDDPGGLGSLLGYSTGTDGTDFVVGDFNHNSMGTYYPKVGYGDPSAHYIVDWQSGGTVLQVPAYVNGEIGGGGTGNCGLVHVYDLYLEAGKEYSFVLSASPSDIRAALFRNPSTGTYWNGRSGAEFELTSVTGHTYVAPATDWYGLVVFDAIANAVGSYTLRVLDAPRPLETGVCQVSAADLEWYSFTQAVPYWSAVAVNPGGPGEKDMWVYNNPYGLGGSLGYSILNTGTNYVIGDFNHNQTGTYYPLAVGTGDHVVDWDTGHLFPVDGSAAGTVGGDNGVCGVIKVWDLLLEGGTTYQVVATSTGDADLRVSLFRNPASAPFWAARSNAEFEIQPNGPAQAYTAPATDFYGLVVFNASPGSLAGSYTLRVDGPASSVPEEAAEGKPGITFGNPYRAGETIELRAAADGTPAQVSVYNLHGQRVRTLMDDNGSVGRSGRRLSWDGRSDAGVRLGAGIYFVRAQIGAEPVKRTLVLLR